MKILLSPAKTLNMELPLPFDLKPTQPIFQKEITSIVDIMRSMSPESIGSLMSISTNLAALNHERYSNFERSFTYHNAKPALFTFAGDVYTGLDASTIAPKHIDYAQQNIRILSGLYGYLRPLDLMQPYRLEMGTSVAIGVHKNLYEFWKEKLTQSLNEELLQDEPVVNLASVEYFRVLDAKKLKGNVISPIFKDHKNGKFKVISFFAKKARGTMARFLVEQGATSLNDVLQFSKDGYAYAATHTTSDLEPVFIR